MVTAMSVENYEAHHVPLQHADQRNHNSFQDMQEPAPEQMSAKDWRELTSLLLKALTCLEYTLFCPHVLDIISRKAIFELESSGVNTMVLSKHFQALLTMHKN